MIAQSVSRKPKVGRIVLVGILNTHNIPFAAPAIITDVLSDTRINVKILTVDEIHDSFTSSTLFTLETNQDMPSPGNWMWSPWINY